MEVSNFHSRRSICRIIFISFSYKCIQVIYLFESETKFASEFGPGGNPTHNLLILEQTPKPSCLGVHIVLPLCSPMLCSMALCPFRLQQLSQEINT